jgi:hypothetical protein
VFAKKQAKKRAKAAALAKKRAKESAKVVDLVRKQAEEKVTARRASQVRKRLLQVWPAGSLCMRLPNARRCPAVVRRHFTTKWIKKVLNTAVTSLSPRRFWFCHRGHWALSAGEGGVAGLCVPSTRSFAHAPTLIRVDAGARSGLLRVGSRHSSDNPGRT